jgi:hypothetical protein
MRCRYVSISKKNDNDLPDTLYCGQFLSMSVLLQKILLFLCFFNPIVVSARDTSDTLPLKSGASDRRGPFALPNVNHHLMGAVYIYGSEKPDLFIAGYGGPRALWLARWSEMSEEGVPVFHPPVQVSAPFTQKATIFQTADSIVRAVWLDGSELAFGIYDAREIRFDETHRLTLRNFPRMPGSVSVFERTDGSFDLIFEIADGLVFRTGDPWSEDWRPYDDAGIWTGGHPYRYLYTARLQGIDGPMSGVRMASETRREVYMSMYRTAVLEDGTGSPFNLVSGSRMGNIYIFRGYHDTDDGVRFKRRELIQGSNGLAIRNPFCSMGVVSYPGTGDTYADLITGGEGALQFYRFSGNYNARGVPVYDGPWPVLQEEGDLYAGSLPVPSVIDWDGDGVLDILSGNSEGRVLFFKNLETNEYPQFANGVPVKAGGSEIHIQAGYSGSVQGLGEARWGYSSPNVIDWNGNGLPDIVMGDITGNYTVYINRGTPGSPELDPAVPLYCDGIDLHGQWRVRPAVARIGEQTALITVDDDDHFHLYWRVDDQNVESAGKLRIVDGSLISASSGYGGMKGRCKLSLFDWDGDGLLDLVISTARHNAIPNQQTGYPKPVLGDRPLGTVLFMRNVGTNEEPVFEHTVPFVHEHLGILQPGGAHESGTVPAYLGPNGPNLISGNETGRLFLFERNNLTW